SPKTRTLAAPVWENDRTTWAAILLNPEFLQLEGIIAARRLYRRPGKPGDAGKASDRVILTLRPNTERPSKVNLRFTRHDVAEYIEAPPRCFN
ncbi:hypothetical protein HPB47_021090, partial [Ixodes persulcatus]